MTDEIKTDAQANTEAPVEKTPAGTAPETTQKPETDQQTPKTTPEQKPVVPAKYELKLPEGSPMDPARLEKIAAYAKERGFSQEQAQELLTREHDAVAQYVEGQNKGLKAKQETWTKTAAEDPEIGGEAFVQNAELAKRVLNRFGSESLIKALDDSQLGNHPELVRTFVRIGKLMSNDQLEVTAVGGDSPKALEDIFYPSQTS